MNKDNFRIINQKIFIIGAVSLISMNIISQTTTTPLWISQKIYIDPSYKGNTESGTQIEPYKSTKSVGFAWTARYAYLFKRGTRMEATAIEEIKKDSVIIGAYGTGERPILSYNVDDRVINITGTGCSVNDIKLIVPPKTSTHGITIGGNGVFAEIANCVVVGGNTGIDAGNAKHLKILNTDVSGCVYDGIYITDNDTTTINGCYVHDMVLLPDRMNQSSIDNIHMESPKVVYIDSLFSDHSNYPGKYALIINGSESVVLKNSILKGHPGNGPVYDGGSSKPWEIDNCYFEGGIYGIQSFSDLIIYNSIFKGQRDAAIKEGFSKWVYNCTFIDESFGVSGWGGGRVKEMKNCIFYNVQYPNSGPSDIITNNCFFNEVFELWPAGDGRINKDPLFVDFKNGNYRLMANSPCKDVGVTIPKSSVDLDGLVRPQGGTIDIGAYEYIAGSPAIFNVTTDGSGCKGDTAAVMTSGSELGVTYKLLRNNQYQNKLMNGTGAALNFGDQSKQGIYSVIATKTGTKISNKMKGNPLVMVNPLPTGYFILGGGFIDNTNVNSNIFLNNSDIGINYQLYCDNNMIGKPVFGKADSLSFGLYANSGIYTVIATDTLSKCTRKMPNYIIIATTSIKNNASKLSVRLWPNPSNGNFSIVFEEPNDLFNKIQIYSLDGSQVFEKQIEFNQKNISVSVNVAPGNYIFVLSNEKGDRVVEKITIGY